MEKTYRFVEHTKPLTEKEIETLYDGYWVFIVNARFTETNGLIDGIPVIIGDMPYDGVEDGIYDKYKDAKYDIQCDMVLTHDKFLASLLGRERRIVV